MGTTTNKLHKTRPFLAGRSQAIRIPNEYRFEDEDVVINKVGDSIIITPVHALQNDFYTGLSMFTGDFLSEGRPAENSTEWSNL